MLTMGLPGFVCLGRVVNRLLHRVGADDVTNQRAVLAALGVQQKRNGVYQQLTPMRQHSGGQRVSADQRVQRRAWSKTYLLQNK